MFDAAWDRAVPDEPRWIEIRSMLLSGDSLVFGDTSGGMVISSDCSLGGVVGHPDEDVFARGLAELDDDADILVMVEGADHIRAMSPQATLEKAIIHRLGSPLPEERPRDYVEIGPVDDDLVDSLPAVLVDEVVGAVFASVRRVEGSIVAVCGAWWPTETLWDVAVDTLEPHRRKGHARACFIALASHMAEEHGLLPVWGALEDNLASLRMAENLGFRPDSELWVFNNPR